MKDSEECRNGFVNPWQRSAWEGAYPFHLTSSPCTKYPPISNSSGTRCSKSRNREKGNENTATYRILISVNTYLCYPTSRTFGHQPILGRSVHFNLGIVRLGDGNELGTARTMLDLCWNTVHFRILRGASGASRNSPFYCQVFLDLFVSESIVEFCGNIDKSTLHPKFILSEISLSYF